MKLEFGPAQIYNLDESGISTVQASGKVIASIGIKQDGHITSAERYVLVTMCACINAIGIPPIFIFPRVHFQEHVLNGAPRGSVGAGMNSEICASTSLLQKQKRATDHGQARYSRQVRGGRLSQRKWHCNPHITAIL